MKLYETTQAMRELHDLVDTGELTQEQIADTMESLDYDFNDKAEAALKVRQHLLYNVANIDKEIERLQALKAAPQNNAQRIADYIKQNMLLLKKDKMDLGLFKLTLRKASQKLGIINEDNVPDMFWTIIPATRKLNKPLLLQEAKTIGNLPFVELVDSERGLTIK